MSDREGQQVGNYQLMRMLGRGTFADVYLGQHIHLHTQAAVKMLHERLESTDAHGFLNEARIIAHLRHAHIVRVLDFGVEDITPFLVMDYIPNGNLRQRYPKGTPVPLDIVVSYARQIADALQYAHRQRLIHRDIKPENILLADNHEVLLSDFGIAILAPHTGSQPGHDAAGTVAYMAPEQFQGHPGPASDQYALGVVVYEWLCGDRPFHGSLSEIAIKHALVPPPSLCERMPALPPAVEQVVLRALAKDPRQRFADTLAFAGALEAASGVAMPGQAAPVNAVEDAGGAEQKSINTMPVGTVTLLGMASGSSRMRPLDVRLNNLSAQLNSLVGREQEVEQVCAMLQLPGVRLVTLTGMGGIGKTRLGLQVATELLATFADGTYFVSLTEASDPADVIYSIAHVLGLEHQYSGQRAAVECMEYLKTYLRDKHLLLLLDNFEQVVAAAPDVAQLLVACPRLKILATSRTALRIQGEHEFQVSTLALPGQAQLSEYEDLTRYAAVTLFLERALAVKPDLALTKANIQAIAAICVHLDGLPLAIELAAARSKLFPPRALLQRMTHRLDILKGDTQGIPARQQTLRDTIAWSYNLLDATEQQLFRRLAVFVGSYALEAAEFIYGTVMDAATPVLDVVASLVDKSLLLQIERDGEESHLLMLDMIREYGLEVLAASGEEDSARQDHVAYYVALAETAKSELAGSQQAAWLNRLEREHANLHAALHWSVEQGKAKHDMTVALRLGVALRDFWIVRGPYSEGRKFLEEALMASEGVATPMLASAFFVAANLAFVQSDFDRAEVLCQRSLQLFRELGDRPGIAHALYLLAWVSTDDINIDVAMVEEALALFKEIDDREYVAWSIYTLAYLDGLRGEYTRAFALIEESLARHTEQGNKRGIAFSLITGAQIHFFARRDPAHMQALLTDSLALFRELDDKIGLAQSYTLRGRIALSQGDVAKARSLVEEGLLLYRELGAQQGVSESLCQLARVLSAQGGDMSAYNLCEESLAIARKVNLKELIASCLEGLAGVVLLQHKPVWAAQLWGQAEVLRETVNVPLPFVDRAGYEQAVAATRSQLGEKVFAAMWTLGRTLALDDVLTAQERDMVAAPEPAAAAIPSPGYPAGLTAREVEVLRLVARGQTNAEIARVLGLSEKTVAHHLTHIFNKTTSENRATATAFAMRHGIA